MSGCPKLFADGNGVLRRRAVDPTRHAPLCVLAMASCEAAGWIGTFLVLAGGVLLVTSIVQVLVAGGRRRPTRPAARRGIAALLAIVAGFVTVALGLTDEEREQSRKASEERRAAKTIDDVEESTPRTGKEVGGPEVPPVVTIADGRPSAPPEAATGAKVEPNNHERGDADTPSGDEISAEFFCERLQVLQKLGGGLGMKPGACVEGKKPEEGTPEFQKLARCLLNVRDIDEYRSRCVPGE